MTSKLNELSLKHLPPHDLDAEKAVLSACLGWEDALGRAMELLDASDFYKGAHREIFKAITELQNRGEPVDVLTVADKLTKLKQLENVDGIEYLDHLDGLVPTGAVISHSANIVKRKKLLRHILAICFKYSELAYECTQEEEDLLQQFERETFALAQKRSARPMKKIKQVLDEAFEVVEKSLNAKDMVTGVPTGYADLDKLLSGLQPTDLIICAARPSMGKTSFALDCARYASLHDYGVVPFFSLEMGSNQLGLRMLCAQAMVDSQRVRTGYLTTDDFPKLTQAAQQLSHSQMEIDDTAILSVQDIRSKVKRIAAQHPLGLIIIDYLQLMTGGKKSESRQLEVSDISRSLKALAKELNVPVLALAQLSRALESRTDKRPLLSDLRESGSIEQDADVVMFIYRDEVYNPDSPDQGIAEIIVRKQRNGPIGTVRLHFQKDITRFFNLTKEGV